jgi:hypothetical protein
MSAKSTSPHNTTRVARLFTTQFYPQAQMCLNFWYKTRGDILFNIRTFYSNKFSSKILYAAKGDRSFEWSLGRLTAKEDESYQIVFEAYDQGQNDGEILLDDIVFTFNECEAIATCTFENSLCGYTSTSKGNFSWINLPGTFSTLQNVSSVPDIDHTFEKPQGHYMYLDTNNKLLGSKALLESEVISEFIGEKCFQFYMRSNENNKASLNIKLKDKFSGNLMQIYSSQQENTNEKWIKKYIDINSKSRPFSLIFEGVVGETSSFNDPNRKAQLAFDDALLEDGNCSSTGFNTTSSITTFSTATTSNKETSSTSNKPNECFPSYCSNKGNCYVVDNKLLCKCQIGLTGSRCEKEIIKKPKSRSEGKFQIYFKHCLKH